MTCPHMHTCGHPRTPTPLCCWYHLYLCQLNAELMSQIREVKFKDTKDTVCLVISLSRLLSLFLSSHRLVQLHFSYFILYFVSFLNPFRFFGSLLSVSLSSFFHFFIFGSLPFSPQSLLLLLHPCSVRFYFPFMCPFSLLSVFILLSLTCHLSSPLSLYSLTSAFPSTSPLLCLPFFSLPDILQSSAERCRLFDP